MFQQSRGAPVGTNTYGNSVLPLYSGASEQNAFNTAMNGYNTATAQANNVFGQSQNALNQLQPAFNSSMTSLGNLYNGQNLLQQLGYQSPLYNANTAFANTQARGLQNVAGANTNAINTGLAQQLAQMNAQNNNQGFLGSSSFNNNRMLQAAIPAYQQAAVGQATANAQGQNLLSQANLGNVGTTAGLQMQNLANQANPGLLASGIGAYSSAQSTPLNQLSSNLQAAQAPLNFFRIGPQAWQAQNMPVVYPQVNAGQIAGGAISSGVGAYNQYQQQQQQNSLYQQLLGQSNMNQSLMGGSSASFMNQFTGGNGNSFSSYLPSPVTNYQSPGNSTSFMNMFSGGGNNSFGTADPYGSTPPLDYTGGTQ